MPGIHEIDNSSSWRDRHANQPAVTIDYARKTAERVAKTDVEASRIINDLVGQVQRLNTLVQNAGGKVGLSYRATETLMANLNSLSYTMLHGTVNLETALKRLDHSRDYIATEMNMPAWRKI